jgi:hypothetical protein
MARRLAMLLCVLWLPAALIGAGIQLSDDGLVPAIRLSTGDEVQLGFWLALAALAAFIIGNTKRRERQRIAQDEQFERNASVLMPD